MIAGKREESKGGGGKRAENSKECERWTWKVLLKVILSDICD